MQVELNSFTYDISHWYFDEHLTALICPYTQGHSTAQRLNLVALHINII